MDIDSTGNCSDAAFSKNMTEQMWRVNALLIVNAILMGVMVGIGAYVQRYRHHPLTRFLFLGATVLFIPILSNVVSTIDNQFIISILFHDEEIITGICHIYGHLVLIFVWAGLVQIVGISTSAIVATDTKEGRSTAPSVLLLVEAIWTVYIVVYFLGTGGNITGSRFSWQHFSGNMDNVIIELMVLAPFALIFAKLIFKVYAFYIARRSFALGRNPHLIVGYMEQWERSQHAGAELIGEHIPPPLVVMGEETVQVDKQPHGHCFKWMFDQVDRTRMNNNGLVTLDKVWRLDDNLLRSIPLKDVCISFATFKLLRCRFAKYTAAEVKFIKVHNFFWQVLLKDSDDERVLGVIADELSFLHDYYYSSLPISYSMWWLPILSIFISLLSIAYCLFATTIIARLLYIGDMEFMEQQVSCMVQCDANPTGAPIEHFGNLMFDIVPVLLLLSLTVLAEARDIAYYICSNWTKVSLICGYVNNASWQQSPTMRKWVGRVLHCRCKLVKPWKDKMNQCSILVLHPRKTPMALLRRLMSLPEQKKNVKVPRAVKAAIIDVLKLRRSEGCLRNNLASLCQSVQIGDNLLWACNGKGTTDSLLVWHIATGIFEVRHPHSSTSNHKIAATHLSRYYAYLMTYSPELLPDYDEWSKSLYKAVKKDIERVLVGRVAVSTPEAEYQQLVELLSAKSKHEVLTNGARLGKQLVDEMEDEETTWRLLAGFWSETILYVAPSDNLDGHAEAIARGGELITLLWALLTHIGIVSRPDSAAAATAGDPVSV